MLTLDKFQLWSQAKQHQRIFNGRQKYGDVSSCHVFDCQVNPVVNNHTANSLHVVFHSFMSAITLLGTPAEIYQFGTMYWLVVVSYILVMPATNYLYMPIFYKLQVTSVYEVRNFH